jgi:hypothetical protein
MLALRFQKIEGPLAGVWVPHPLPTFCPSFWPSSRVTGLLEAEYPNTRWEVAQETPLAAPPGPQKRKNAP